MGTLASGSIDLKSLKVAGEGASKYITTIDSNNGIQVHAQNNTAEHYVQINADGMEVFKDNDSKAFFGEIVRIGRENQASIIIDDSSITGYGENGKEFFTFGNSTTTASTNKNFTVLRLSDASSVPAPNNSLSPLTATLYDTPNSNTFYVYFEIFAGSSTATLAPFKKGTSETKTATVNILGNSYQFNVSYDGDKYFSNIKALTSIPNTYKVAIFIVYSSDTIAPSYELGVNLSTTGGYSYAEGYGNIASGNYSHAEGYNTYASGNYSHAEGYNTDATGNCSHAEGISSTASGRYSHAEGITNTASGDYSHAEGNNTTASKNGAHAEGDNTQANGTYSHSQNQYTIAEKRAQTALGTYNIKDESTTTTHPTGITAYGQYAVIIGNGIDINNRSNALTIDWNGNVNALGQYENLYKITTVQKVISGGINANSYVAGANITMTAQSGYNAVGIVGHSSSNFRVQPTTNYVSNNTTIFAGFANWSASNVTSDVTVIFYVLWLKATAAS